MNSNHRQCLILPWVAAALWLAATSSAPAAEAERRLEPKQNMLQVQVVVPPMWEPMLEDDITEAFVSRVREVFERQGYKGEIEEVSRFDEPSSGCCLLTINLIEWRARRGPTIECTFSATLQTGNTTRNLGIFTDMAFRWMNSPGRFGLADTFGEAAEGAIRQMYRDIAKTELVPGLRN